MVHGQTPNQTGCSRGIAVEVTRASVLGMCNGVSRALDIVMELGRTNPDTAIGTIGPLIHNSRVLKKLESLNIFIVSEPSDIPPGIVVIRAHGVSPAERSRFEMAGHRVVDATCPRVLSSQRQAVKAAEEGYHVVIVGDREHGEVLGIAGHVVAAVGSHGVSVVSSLEDAQQLVLNGRTKVIAQTTISNDLYEAVLAALARKGVELRSANSICPATRNRQRALLELLDKVEAVVVVGGRNSANTSSLYSLLEQNGIPGWHVEGAEELPPEVANYRRIGLTAGASTPEWIIKEVEDELILRG